jgi:hypothetical protein
MKKIKPKRPSKKNTQKEVTDSVSDPSCVAEFLATWEKFYFEVLGIKADLSKIKLSSETPIQNVFIMQQGLKPMELVASSARFLESFITIYYDDESAHSDPSLDMIQSLRKASHTYTFYCLPWVSLGDNDNWDLRNECHGITLEECILVELYDFWSGKVDWSLYGNRTLCLGSRSPSGLLVPVVERSITHLIIKFISIDASYLKFQTKAPFVVI